MMLRKRNSALFGGIVALGLIAATILLLFASPSSLFAGADDWSASYWNNRDLQGQPVLVRLEPAIDHDWAGLSPEAGTVNVDNFSARWVRTHHFASGTYKFKATMDDGMRVWVDGLLIINDWQDGKVRTVEADVNLKNGPHKLTVEYYEAGGKAIAGFTWDNVDGTPDGPSYPPPPGGPMPPVGGPMPPTGGPGMPPSGDVIYPVGVVKSPYLNLRSGPGTNYPVIGVVQQGSEVYLIARSSGSTWYMVKTQGGPMGWVKRYYIHTDFPYTSLPFAQEMQNQAPKPPSQPSMQPSGVVNTGFLNVRSGPGSNYRAVAVIGSGTNVLLLGRSSGGSWLKVQIPTGTVGWVGRYYIATDYPIQNLPVG